MTVFAATYLGWDFALYGMVAGALITVVGSMADPAAEPTDRGERSVL